jgi:hypothetical protein
MIVLELGGVASLLHREAVPAEMHDVVGPRLPDELYYLISQGTINVQLLNNLVSGVLLESPPLVDSQEYRYDSVNTVVSRSLAHTHIHSL